MGTVLFIEASDTSKHISRTKGQGSLRTTQSNLSLNDSGAAEVETSHGPPFIKRAFIRRTVNMAEHINITEARQMKRTAAIFITVLATILIAISGVCPHLSPCPHLSARADLL